MRHEAGHCAAVLACRGSLTKVWINADGSGGTQYSPDGLNIGHLTHIVLAGPACGGEGLHHAMCGSDRQHIIDDLRAFIRENRLPERSDSELLDFASTQWDSVSDLLAEHGRFVARLTRELVAKRVLMGDEVVAIWNQFSPR